MHSPTTSLLLLALAGAACQSEPPSATDAPAAVKELGIYNLSAPFPRVLCSGQPTEAQFDALKDAGVTTVIHLRPQSESGTGFEEEHAKAQGLEFVRFPINVRKGDLNKDKVAAFAKLLADHGDGTTLVSCGSSNRVGSLFALKAFWIDGKSKDEALAIGRSAGMTRLADMVAKLMDP
ncbi:MAG TPA: hypothetical protein ENI87_08905 [bacterium]|nr:hypothetical protein [bacterium]